MSTSYLDKINYAYTPLSNLPLLILCYAPDSIGYILPASNGVHPSDVFIIASPNAPLGSYTHMHVENCAAALHIHAAS